MADGDIVKKITISATGENVDATARAIAALEQATAKANAAAEKNTKANKESSFSLVDLAASIYVANTGLGILDRMLTSINDGTGSAYNSFNKLAFSLGLLVTDAILYAPRKVGEIWKEGTDKLDTYVKLNDTAGKQSVDFYQRIVAGANSTKQPVDTLIAQLDTLEKSLTRTLGSDTQNGSSFNTKVQSLSARGNLGGQRDAISTLNNAIGSEEQQKAAFRLIQQTMDAGQKLVALDITQSLFGDKARDNLQKDADYLFKIEQAMDKAKAADLIKQPDVDRAVGLKIALEDAYNYIDNRNKKAESDWSGWGIEIQSVWVSIVAGYANALRWLDKIFDRSSDIAKKSEEIKPARWSGYDQFNSGMSSEDIIAQYGGNQTSAQYQDAARRLGSQLQNPANVARNSSYLQEAGDKLGPDQSLVGNYGKASDEVAKYVEQTKRATDAVNQTTAEQQRVKFAADLYAAALKDGLNPELGETKRRLDELVKSAGDAADKLSDATKLKAAQDSFKSLADGIKASNDASRLEVEYHGKGAGALKEAQVNAQLYTSALKFMTPEQAAAAVSASGLGKEAGQLAQKLETLNKVEKKDAYDRASEGLLKYIETTRAASKSIDDTAAAQERLKAIAQLTAAGIKDGLTPEAAKARAELSGLGDKAGAAADQLARARVESQIKFDRATAFLSADDVQIATQLRGIYGKDIPAALNSSEAAAINLNNEMKQVGSIINTTFDSMAPAIREAVNGTANLGDSFKKLGLTAVNALQDMIIKLTIIKPLMSALGGSGFSLGSLFGGSKSPELPNFGTDSFIGPKFATGTDFAPGGPSLVGEEGPEIVNLPRGSQVMTNSMTRAALSNSNPVSVSYAPVYHVTGSGPEIAALRSQMQQDRADFEARTIATVRKAQSGRKL